MFLLRVFYIVFYGTIHTLAAEEIKPSQIYAWSIPPSPQAAPLLPERKITLPTQFEFRVRPAIFHSIQNEYGEQNAYIIAGDIGGSCQYLCLNLQNKQIHVLQEAICEGVGGSSINLHMNGAHSGYRNKVLAMGTKGLLLEDDGFYNYNGTRQEFDGLIYEYVNPTASADFLYINRDEGQFQIEGYHDQCSEFICYDVFSGQRMTIPLKKILQILGKKTHAIIRCTGGNWCYASTKEPIMVYQEWGAEQISIHSLPFIPCNNDYNNAYAQLAIDSHVYFARKENCYIYSLNEKRGKFHSWPILDARHHYAGRENEFAQEDRKMVHHFPNGEIALIKRSLHTNGQDSLFQVLIFKNNEIVKRFATTHRSDFKHLAKDPSDFGSFRQVDKYLVLPRTSKTKHYIYDFYDVTTKKITPVFTFETQTPCYYYHHLVKGKVWAFSKSTYPNY